MLHTGRYSDTDPRNGKHHILTDTHTAHGKRTSTCYKIRTEYHIYPVFLSLSEAQVKYGVVSPKFIWAPAYTTVLMGWDPATPALPPHLGSYTMALLVSQGRRHRFVIPWSELSLCRRRVVLSLYSMDEGTWKTPIHLCRLYWSFFGVVKVEGQQYTNIVP